MTLNRLEQAKLDVTRKTRANLFNWRGQFTPELVEYLLTAYASEGDVIADPFAGSGTVLLEGARRQIDSFGLEINPAAYPMSRFYTLCALDACARADVLDCFEQKLNNAARPVESAGRCITGCHQMINTQRTKQRTANCSCRSFQRKQKSTWTRRCFRSAAEQPRA